MHQDMSRSHMGESNTSARAASLSNSHSRLMDESTMLNHSDHLNKLDAMICEEEEQTGKRVFKRG